MKIINKVKKRCSKYLGLLLGETATTIEGKFAQQLCRYVGFGMAGLGTAGVVLGTDPGPMSMLIVGGLATVKSAGLGEPAGDDPVKKTRKSPKIETAEEGPSI